MRGSGLSIERFIKGKAQRSKSDAKSKKKTIIHKAQRRREYEKVKRREGAKAADASEGATSFYDKFFSDLKSGEVDEDGEQVERTHREKGEQRHEAKPDPFFKAKKKAAVTKSEKLRAREEKKKRVAEAEKKVTQRKKRHVKLSQRTATGQPVVRNHINDLLSRLQAEKKR